MKTSPIYGAKAADIMVNMLYRNNFIREIIDNSYKKLNRQPESVLICEMMGAGTHQISTTDFSEMQEKFLGAKVGCRVKTVSDQLQQPTKGIQ
jgi:hypothetical protein